MFSALSLLERSYLFAVDLAGKKKIKWIGWLFGFYCILLFVGYLMRSTFYINNQFYFKYHPLVWAHSLIIKNISILFRPIQFSQIFLIQTIQFSISLHFSSIRLVYRAQSGTTTPGKSGPASDGNEGMLRIPQSSSITEASPSDCLASYLGYSLGESYPSAEVPSVYSTRLGKKLNWGRFKWIFYKVLHYLENNIQFYTNIFMKPVIITWIR